MAVISLISLSKFNLSLKGIFTRVTPHGPYRSTTCRKRELTLDHRDTLFDHTRMRDQLNAGASSEKTQTWKTIPSTHPFILTRRILKDDYDGQMIFGDLVGLKLPDICGEEKNPKNSPRKPVPTGDWTRARCVTIAHATTCSTAVDSYFPSTMYNRDLLSSFYFR